MRVFVLGGTGRIGSAVVRELVSRGHEVHGLARSDASANKLAGLGATPLPGDIASPERWIGALPHLDAMIHAACDFSTAMGEIDRHLLDVLLPALAAQPKKPRFIYTGGCWLFGATGDDVATEETPFRPLPAFAWMVPNLQRVLDAPGIDGIVIHPAMVYEPGGGVFLRMAREARERDAIRVVESEAVRWPLVHSDDLATLYALALEHGAFAIELYRRSDRRARRRPHRARLRETLRHAAARAGNHFRRSDSNRAWRLGERLCARPAAKRRESAA